MKTCIYCEKKEGDVTFERVEHVVPRLMGVFDNNLTLRGWVCDVCNSEVFSRLETKFKEDTQVGIVYQMFNFENRYQLRILQNSVKSSFAWGLGDIFFDEMFPKLGLIDGEIKIFPQSQIKINRHGDNGYLILLVDELQKLNRDCSKFRNLKKHLSGVKSKEVSTYIQAMDNSDTQYIEDAIQLIKDLGIDYKEGPRKFAEFDKGGQQRAEMVMDITMGNDVGRVMAKIAFNYFAYNAIQEGSADILFYPNFNKIRSYILGTATFPIKQIVTAIENDSFIRNEQGQPIRLLGHAIAFSEENGNIVTKMCFLGHTTYTITLGEIPSDLSKKGFGSGHLFDPLNKKILGLTQNQSKIGSDTLTRFGLFNGM